MDIRFAHLSFKTVIAISLAVLFQFFGQSPSFSAENRDFLWNLVSTCIDTRASDYCTRCIAPRAEIDCRSCRNTTQVWAESKEFVAIRDRKMCDCPDGFVHGLVVPRSRVTGVEDTGRPDGIWEFAWAEAAKRLKEDEIALAVNPKGKRSQDQLHVHIVRLRKGSLPDDMRRMVRVDSLRGVWDAASGKAAKLNWTDYGVLVTRGAGSGYMVVIDDGSPEYDYTLANCR
ncbi:MAG TPA: CDP-diacylglycerol diphosphatase [Geobacteraceae bacterium]|nr:CDP-diacylglycerol diphosphatase [Geobacteraceae bacterium]